ncbi:hypothetical protein GCM10027037_07180 [Mucilaginibacter koreensis]
MPVLVFAQNGTITGRITRSDSKAPIEKVSVFLNNATYGTATNSEGYFTLSGIKPGQYDLVATSVGYNLYSQPVMVSNTPVNLSIQLSPKTTELRGVVITTPEGWRRNYEMFVKYFVGTSADAKKCKIVNPHDLYMVYDRSTKTLEASSDDFIIIENYALGYREKVLINEFKYNGIDETTEWSTRALFEDLPGSASQKQRWQQRRDDVYYGYNTHFFRALAAGRMKEEGFEIRTLVRKPNPLRPPEKVIQQKMNYFQRVKINNDSANYWINKYNLPKWDDKLFRLPMIQEQIMQSTPQPGIFVLAYRDLLYVTYKNRYETELFRDVYHPLDMENYETTVITLLEPYAVFDANGHILSSHSTLYEGSWTKNKGAELLPLDYVPKGGPPHATDK